MSNLYNRGKVCRKESMKKLLNKINILIQRINRYYYIGIIFILMLACSYMFYLNITHEENSSTNNIVSSLVEDTPKKEISKIYIDIKGNVNNPGVYELEEGKRVIDAINASGGLKKGSNTRFINLSKVLEDGDVIVIYSNQEIEDAKKSNIIYVDSPCVCEEVKNDACYKEENNENNLININTATKEDLMTLSGIGDAKAQNIIDYRTNNGNFNSINDLVNVSGISETIFSKIKENITI